jgi:vacuolar-type H+-ATPase subunit H
MAKEAVQAVRQAEINAADIEKEAIRKKEVIISESQQKAKEIIADMTRQAQAKAEQDLALAEQKERSFWKQRDRKQKTK